MTIVMGLDLHRAQITAEWIDASTGEPVTLRITSDRAAELHVHALPEQEIEVAKGESTVEITVENPGLVDVEERVLRIPVGPWSRDPHLRELGHAWRQTIMQGLSADSVALFHAAWGRSPETTQVMLARVRKELMDPNLRAWSTLHVVWGRTPQGVRMGES